MGGLAVKQSIQAMTVGTGSKAAAERSYDLSVYIAALSQLHPLRLEPKMKRT